MTHICLKHRGVNLAQESPNFAAPAEVKEAALKAIRADLNQYAITWGMPNLCQAILEKVAWYEWIPTRWRQEYDENILSFLEDFEYEREDFTFFLQRVW
jgi:hypothetical protein